MTELVKPANCTCRFPETIARNMNGHEEFCPVYQEWYKNSFTEKIPYPGMRNLYRAITGKDCPEHIALGMATSAVSGLIAETNKLLKESNELKQQIDHLISAIKKHYDQKADDRCWQDDIELYAAAGLPIPEDVAQIFGVGDKGAMLKNCERFLEKRCLQGGDWKSYAELEAENESLKHCLFQMQEAAKDILRQLKEKEGDTL